MVNRRHFLKQFGAFSLAFSGFGCFSGKAANLNDLLEQTNGQGYGPLLKDPNGILDLPKGFSFLMAQMVTS
jgi:hypothetical protein